MMSWRGGVCGTNRGNDNMVRLLLFGGGEFSK